MGESPAMHLGEYAIERELGERSFLARCGGRRVVLKRIEEGCLLEGELHPHVKDRLGRVRELAEVGVGCLISVERIAGEVFLVWEWVEGRTLREWAEGKSGEDVARAVREVVQRVESMHGLGIVHGAIHAGNVIVGPDGRVKLVHVSELLFDEESADVTGVRGVLEEMGMGEIAQAVRDRKLGLREIERLLSGRGRGEEKDGQGSVIRKRAVVGAIVAGLVGLGVVLGVGWWLWEREKAERPPEVGNFELVRCLESGAGVVL